MRAALRQELSMFAQPWEMRVNGAVLLRGQQNSGAPVFQATPCPVALSERAPPPTKPRAEAPGLLFLAPSGRGFPLSDDLWIQRAVPFRAPRGALDVSPGL